MLYIAAIILLLVLSAPLLGGAPVAGLPLWAWGSLLATAGLAVVIVAVIEKQWDTIALQEEPDA